MSHIFLKEHSEELRTEITQSLLSVFGGSVATCAVQGHQNREGTKRVKSGIFKTSFAY